MSGWRPAETDRTKKRKNSPIVDSHIPDYHPWMREPIPSEDGFLHLEYSGRPVPYHIARCFDGRVDSHTCRTLALSACRVSCMSMDIVRGRLPSSKLHRTVTGQCLRRLDTMRVLLGRETDSRLKRDRLPFHPLGILPVVPQSLTGMLVSPTRIELTTHLTIGSDHHSVNVILRQQGCRWICVMVDVG